MGLPQVHPHRLSREADTNAALRTRVKGAGIRESLSNAFRLFEDRPCIGFVPSGATHGFEWLTYVQVRDLCSRLSACLYAKLRAGECEECVIRSRSRDF